MKQTKSKLYLIVMAIMSLFFIGCVPDIPRKNPVGLAFPQVQGTSLKGNPYTIPDDFSGKPRLLLIGYIQDSQFDIDRWLLGLTQLKTPVAISEIPAVPGIIPRMTANKIDSGMRSGIPREDWGSVITVYKDADTITNFTGTADPLNSRVALLDRNGKIIWFHDRGYSASLVSDLDRVVRSLNTSSVE